MKSSPFIYLSDNVYEIMSRIDDDIYFEIEILCDGTKDILRTLKSGRADVLANTYMHQCTFLIDNVLNYIRSRSVTTVHFVKGADRGTRNACRKLHLREVQQMQSVIKEAFERFSEAVSFIYPGDSYPQYLFNLKTKMMFIDVVMTDLFSLEKTKLIPQAKQFPHALEFEGNLMN